MRTLLDLMELWVAYQTRDLANNTRRVYETNAEHIIGSRIAGSAVRPQRRAFECYRDDRTRAGAQ